LAREQVTLGNILFFLFFIGGRAIITEVTSGNSVVDDDFHLSSQLSLLLWVIISVHDEGFVDLIPHVDPLLEHV